MVSLRIRIPIHRAMTAKTLERLFVRFSYHYNSRNILDIEIPYSFYYEKSTIIVGISTAFVSACSSILILSVIFRSSQTVVERELPIIGSLLCCALLIYAVLRQSLHWQPFLCPRVIPIHMNCHPMEPIPPVPFNIQSEIH